ncbi:MAG: 4-(cytidine 5'-diphospho)-2-C-methyl-D-erythritol kinase [Candidatus Omnitrophica bacterium]|nr:4-(cytidine 5'-diphospho)-2-C-methyl-D-erythritol kinase [Candidatus Omnitrophota bacterium]
MKELSLTSPAKINLFLNVLERMPDGYHRIETLFERISLCDDISFTLLKKGRLEVVMEGAPGVPRQEDNLAFRAARLLKAHLGISAGARIRVAKRIPIGAGLAGGSSNAATTLEGLCRLWSLSVPHEVLMALGASLGADVPFFVSGASRAIGRGRGDEIEPVRGSARFWYVLVTPNVIVRTKEIYEKWEHTFSLTTGRDRLTLIACAVREGDLLRLGNALYNSLEPITAQCIKDIDLIKGALLHQGARYALMSGSGPTVFGIADDEGHAGDIARNLASLNKNWRVTCAHSII